MNFKSIQVQWLVLGLAAFLLLPYLSTGFYCDDILNSCTRGYTELHQITITESVRIDLMGWLTQAGRLTPIGQIYHYFWYYLPSLTFYRWYQTALTFLCIVFFAKMLKQMGIKESRIWLSCATAPALFQIRNYHDPITSYGGMIQIAFLFGVGAALLLGSYLKKGNGVYLVTALFLFVVQLLTYELVVIFLPIYFMICWNQRLTVPKRRVTLACLGFVGTTLLDVIATIYIRRHFGSVYSGIQFGSIGFNSLWAFICQSSAAFPFLYQVFGKSGFFHFRDFIGPEFISIVSLILFIFSGALFYRLFEKAESELSPSFPLKWVGLVLMLTPSIMMASNFRYQREINRFGSGYLPVFFAYFGVAILFSQWAPQWIKKGIDPVQRRRKLALFAAVSVVFTFNANRIAAREINRVKMGNRVLIQEALESGLMSEVPETAVIFHEENPEWTIPPCTMQFAHRKNEWVYRSPKLYIEPYPQSGFVLKANQTSEGKPYVLLSSLEKNEGGYLIRVYSRSSKPNESIKTWTSETPWPTAAEISSMLQIGQASGG